MNHKNLIPEANKIISDLMSKFNKAMEENKKLKVENDSLKARIEELEAFELAILAEARRKDDNYKNSVEISSLQSQLLKALARIEELETLQVKDVYLRTDGDFVVVEVSIGAASIELIREFVGQTGNTISHNYNLQHSGFPKVVEEAQAALKDGSE